MESLRKQGYYKQVHSHAHFVRFSSLFIDYKLRTTNYELIIPPFREESKNSGVLANRVGATFMVARTSL